MLSRFIHAGSVYARMDRQEAVPVPEHHQERAFYHGTPNEEVAQKILQSGELRPGIEWEPGGSTEDWTMAPMAGQVYFTPSLKYVLAHVLGAHESCPPDVLCKRGGQYGYLFVVPGSTLTDLLPDEDTIGELLCEKEFPWLNEEYDKIAYTYWQELEHIAYQIAENEYEGQVEEKDDWEEIHERPLPSWEEYWHEYYDFNEMLMDCSYPEVAVAGKFFLRHVDEDIVIELLEELENIDAVSHDGAVPFTEAWRFDKKRVRELKGDGSNFFELAERVR